MSATRSAIMDNSSITLSIEGNHNQLEVTLRPVNTKLKKKIAQEFCNIELFESALKSLQPRHALEITGPVAAFNQDNLSKAFSSFRKISHLTQKKAQVEDEAADLMLGQDLFRSPPKDPSPPKDRDPKDPKVYEFDHPFYQTEKGLQAKEYLEKEYESDLRVFESEVQKYDEAMTLIQSLQDRIAKFSQQIAQLKEASETAPLKIFPKKIVAQDF